MQQERDVIAPASKPQELFINSEADITIASGSAGSSKSYSILLRFLRYISCPYSRGVIFRRTSTQLLQQGGLWDDALALYSRVDPNLKIKIKDRKLIFSTGASLQFSHYENEAAKEKFKGLQADYIAFDEATEFTEEMITYLRSRNRNADAERYHKASLCMATNPHCDSFLKDWVWWWLDPETGIPDPDKRGVTRYFVKQRDGSLDWYATRKEAEAVYGSEEDSGITSMCVIGSTVYDNPYISKAYIGKLKEQSRVEQDRLLYGSWTAREEGTGYFKRAWVKMIKHPPIHVVQRVRAWDLAASEPSEKYRDPDYTAGVLMSKDKNKVYTVEHVVRCRKKFLGVEELILKTALADGRDVIITLPLDAGAGGQSYAKTLQAKLAEFGFTVRLVKPKANKVLRFGAFAAMAEAGYVQYVSDEGYSVEEQWNTYYLNELEQFDGGRKGHDDQVDSTSDAFNHISRQMVLPSFNLTSFTQANPFNRDF